jgi:hypothetical protein
MPNPSDLITTDLDILALQEKELRFSHFDPDTAWALGLIVRELAVARRYSIVIDIRRFGSPNQSLFYSALRGTTPDNARWVERKSNVVARFHRSSYSLGLKLQHDNITTSQAPESSERSPSPASRSARITTSPSKACASPSAPTTRPCGFRFSNKKSAAPRFGAAVQFRRKSFCNVVSVRRRSSPKPAAFVLHQLRSRSPDRFQACW